MFIELGSLKDLIGVNAPIGVLVCGIPNLVVEVGTNLYYLAITCLMTPD